MPDFEALIRHQQLKQPSTNKRLKIVDEELSNLNDTKNSQSNDWKSANYFIMGFIGAVIGSFTILFLDINKYIPLDIFKIN